MGNHAANALEVAGAYLHRAVPRASKFARRFGRHDASAKDDGGHPRGETSGESDDNSNSL